MTTPSHWNHRVILKREDSVVGSLERIEIHEAFYNADGKTGFTGTPTPVMCDKEEGIERLRQILQWMLECLDKPVLDFETGQEVEL